MSLSTIGGSIKEMDKWNNFHGSSLVSEEFSIKVRDELLVLDAQVWPSPLGHPKKGG